MILSILNISAFVTVFIYLWTKTNAVFDYLSFFNIKFLNRWFKIDKYKDALFDDITLTYIDFLNKNYRNFFIKLITCPVCFSIWLSIIISILSGLFPYTPIIIFSSWIMYFGFIKLKG